LNSKSNDCPSIVRVIRTDLALSYITILPVIPIGIFIIEPTIKALLLEIPFATFSISVIYWWHSRVCRAFKYGKEVQGKVVSANRTLNSGYVFVYIFHHTDGKKMIHGSTLVDSERLRKIKKGDLITILLDPKDKNRSFPKQAYLN
jgi:hypothetical protein